MNKHFFLSYCHNDWSNVKKIFDGLRERGYKVWLDKVDMKGGRVDSAMMEGIKNSEVFLMAVSSGYQGSDSCRLEFNYAKNKQKKVVIVIVEENYKMDDWMEFQLSNYLYTRMSKLSLEELLDDVLKMSGKVSVGKQLLAPLTYKWDIFLSYCRKDWINVKKIYDGLGERGYKVWLDTEEMKGGRVDDALIDGMDNSEVFLMAVSSGYEKSGSCRHEFDYAQPKQKIVVIVEEGYKMGGWIKLGVAMMMKYTRMSKVSLDELLDVIYKISGKVSGESRGMQLWSYWRK